MLLRRVQTDFKFRLPYVSRCCLCGSELVSFSRLSFLLWQSGSSCQDDAPLWLSSSGAEFIYLNWCSQRRGTRRREWEEQKIKGGWKRNTKIKCKHHTEVCFFFRYFLTQLKQTCFYCVLQWMLVLLALFHSGLSVSIWPLFFTHCCVFFANLASLAQG